MTTAIDKQQPKVVAFTDLELPRAAVLRILKKTVEHLMSLQHDDA